MQPCLKLSLDMKIVNIIIAIMITVLILKSQAEEKYLNDNQKDPD